MVLEEDIFLYSNYIPTKIILIGILTVLLWWYSNKKQSYWRDRNIPYVKPLPFIGSLLDTVKKPLHVLELKRYFSLGPIYGVFEGNRPALIVGDPQLIRDIFVKDFSNFQNRRILQTGNKISDQSLLFDEGEHWKRMRIIVSPTFTTKKLKRILAIFKDSSEILVQNFKVTAQRNEPADVRRYLDAFLLDVIASSAFSTKIDSLNDPENDFVKYSNRNKGTWFKFKLSLIVFLTSWPLLKKFIKLAAVDRAAIEFFSDVVKQIISERRKTKQTRDDFLQLLLDLEEKTVSNNKKDHVENDDCGPDVPGQNNSNGAFQKNLTNDELISQCVTFFFAAHDTTSSLLAFALYFMATNEDIQEKAYQEISEHLKDTNGELTYEALQNMKYMDNIMSETLRLYPPSVRIARKSEKKYKLGDTGITLEKDMVVMIPAIAIHRDPKYYPDPEKFDPDRFSAEKVADRDPYVYLPFGHGPRSCVGMRFAQLSAKVCLVYVISCFKVKTCSRTVIPVEIESGSYFTMTPKDVTVALEIRNDCPLVHT